MKLKPYVQLGFLQARSLDTYNSLVKVHISQIKISLRHDQQRYHKREPVF